jgi:hypothetical protein
MNEAMGVTRQQEAAMLAGSLLGWDSPAAKPWSYDETGKPIVRLSELSSDTPNQKNENDTAKGLEPIQRHRERGGESR